MTTLHITNRSRMQRTNIAPNRTRPPRPMHPRHTVMVIRDQPHRILTYHSVFIRRHPIDAAHMQARPREK